MSAELALGLGFIIGGVWGMLASLGIAIITTNYLIKKEVNRHGK